MDLASIEFADLKSWRSKLPWCGKTRLTLGVAAAADLMRTMGIAHEVREAVPGSSIFKSFITERLITAPGVRTQAKTLIDAFERFCQERGEPVWHQATFGKAMAEAGFGKQFGRHVHYLDVCLKATDV